MRLYWKRVTYRDYEIAVELRPGGQTTLARLGTYRLAVYKLRTEELWSICIYRENIYVEVILRENRVYKSRKTAMRHCRGVLDDHLRELRRQKVSKLRDL